MKLRITHHESSWLRQVVKRSSTTWLRIIGGLAVIVVAVFFVRPFLPASYHAEEPLAEADSLSLLMKGRQLPEPPMESLAQFHGLKSSPPALIPIRNILGDTSSEKRIEVDLTNQKVYAYEGERKVYEFIVSTGKWAHTPTGEFRIWAKVQSQKMSGGDKSLGTYYYLPNVPYVMFFYNDSIAKMRGFSFHGTYWHDNFGHPMSHGCVNMRISEAQTLYEWASPVVINQKAWSTLANATNEGTRVIIYGETPRE